MAAKTAQKLPEAQNPLIVRCHRLMEAFAKSDDERDFYLDRIEGFILFANLDKTQEELEILEKELQDGGDRYCMIPKLTFFETKKIMEGFVNEKVYDIDTKEKLLDIIQSKEAREHFLEFIYDHHSELEKWQQFYQERSRIRIIEWLRIHHFNFVFEEDLELASNVIENLKENLFEKKVSKEIESARKLLSSKAKSYYSNEALNPRPKRGRPPKQIQKLELEHQATTDIYTTVPVSLMPFLFTPDISSVFDVTFSSRFESGRELLAHSRHTPDLIGLDDNLDNISHKLAALRQISNKWMEKEKEPEPVLFTKKPGKAINLDQELEDEEEEELFQKLEKRKLTSPQKPAAKKAPEVIKSKVNHNPVPIKNLPIKGKTVQTINSKKEPPSAPKKNNILPSKNLNKKRIISQTKTVPKKTKPPISKPTKKIIKSAPKSAPQKNALPTKSKKASPPKRLLRKTTPKKGKK